MRKTYDFDEPVNSNERYLYAIAVRMDAMCSMLSSIIEYIADKEKIAVTSNIDKREEVVVEVEPSKPKKSKSKPKE